MMRFQQVLNLRPHDCCNRQQVNNFALVPGATSPFGAPTSHSQDSPFFHKFFLPLPLQGGCFAKGRLRASRSSQGPSDGRKQSRSDPDHDSKDDSSSTKGAASDPDLMDTEERREWRRKIKQVIGRNPDVEEEVDPDVKRAKMQNLIADYPLVVEEEDPNWTDDAEGWGFNLGQFFDKITIKNEPPEEGDDDAENNDEENEIVWKDDNYIRPIKDIKAADWEDTVFRDISPLIILVHNRYKRPKDNEKVRDELVKAVHIIWNCRLPSPRCVAVDAVVDTDLVSALEVSIFPEIIFTKSGMILHREKAFRTADEYSKMMAYFYYGAAKPPCLSEVKESKQLIPSISTRK